jgi:hypothetical protein
VAISVAVAAVLPIAILTAAILATAVLVLLVVIIVVVGVRATAAATGAGLTAAGLTAAVLTAGILAVAILAITVLTAGVLSVARRRRSRLSTRTTASGRKGGRGTKGENRCCAGKHCLRRACREKRAGCHRYSPEINSTLTERRSNPNELPLSLFLLAGQNVVSDQTHQVRGEWFQLT